MVPAGTCTVARDCTELRIAVALDGRIVHLQLRGLADAGYMLQVVHESGNKALEFGRPGGEHTLLLPPGPCMMTLKRSVDGRPESVERVYVVTEAIEQELVWDIAAEK